MPAAKLKINSIVMDVTYFDNENIIEESYNARIQEETEQPDIEKKYRLGEIRIVTEQARYPLGNILNMMKTGQYILDPVYQRRGRWSVTRQSRLIESFIMNVPIPPIFLYEADYATYEIMDGKQRISTICDFYEDKFALENLEYWSELNGLKYSQLPGVIKLAIDRRYISSIILLNESSDSNEKAEWMKMMVFDRINSGGVRMEYQESRNAKYQGSFNDMVCELSENESLRRIFGIPVRTDYDEEEQYLRDLETNMMYCKMQDCEFVVRFFAMRFIHYYESIPLNVFLDRFTESANKLPSEVLQQYADLFNNTINLMYAIFEDEAFRPWRFDKNRNLVPYSMTSMAISDPMMLAMSQLIENRDKLMKSAKDIRSQFAKLLFENRARFNSRDNKKSSIVERTEFCYDFLKRFV